MYYSGNGYTLPLPSESWRLFSVFHQFHHFQEAVYLAAYFRLSHLAQLQAKGDVFPLSWWGRGRNFGTKAHITVFHRYGDFFVVSRCRHRTLLEALMVLSKVLFPQPEGPRTGFPFGDVC